jgi:hypothetical protein
LPESLHSQLKKKMTIQYQNRPNNIMLYYASQWQKTIALIEVHWTVFLKMLIILSAGKVF